MNDVASDPPPTFQKKPTAYDPGCWGACGGQGSARRRRWASKVTHMWAAEYVRIWLAASLLSSVLDGWMNGGRCCDGESTEKWRMWEKKECLPHCHPMPRKAVSQYRVGGLHLKNKAASGGKKGPETRASESERERGGVTPSISYLQSDTPLGLHHWAE